MLEAGGVTQVLSTDATSTTPDIDLNSNLLTISGCPSSISDPSHTFTFDIYKLSNYNFVKETDNF